MITNHTQILNALIEKYNLSSYLEIGVQNPAQNFDKINCDVKVGVDPAITSILKYGHVCTHKTETHEAGDVIGWYELNGCTSDDFFANKNRAWSDGPRRSFDIVFVDGLHHADQVKRDFENSLRCLSDNGFILIHDVLPENEQGTRVPRETRQWWGDVYKWAMNIGQYTGIGYKTFNIDNGCMLVWKDATDRQGDPFDGNLCWESFQVFGHKLMNVINEVTI